MHGGTVWTSQWPPLVLSTWRPLRSCNIDCHHLISSRDLEVMTEPRSVWQQNKREQALAPFSSLEAKHLICAEQREIGLCLVLPGYPHRMPTPVWLPPISTDPRIAGGAGCQAILGPKALLFSPVCMTLLPKLAPSQNIFSRVSCFPFSFNVSNLLHSKPHMVLTTLHCSFTTTSDPSTCYVCCLHDPGQFHSA